MSVLAPRLVSLALALLALAMSGCDQSRKQIVGKWTATGSSGAVVWEFFSNGALAVDGSPGRYSFGDRQRIKVETKTATFVYQCQLTGDRMVWTSPDGTRTEFVRLK